jgi:Ubiquinol-cytochrome C reductase hinge protein
LIHSTESTEREAWLIFWA